MQSKLYRARSGLLAKNLFQLRCLNQRICIVGSGPSGFYSAKYLLESNPTIHVDMVERLPVPFGLVRFGVAPDHPEVKSVMSTFNEVAINPHFRFFGNVCVGKDVSLEILLREYSAVLLAYGASSDRKLQIPGDTCDRVIPARHFVNWYNGHPDFVDFGKNIDFKKIKSVVIIGQGNVALDCARILAKSTSELEGTDIRTEALTQLHGGHTDSSSKDTTNLFRDIYVVGRRGVTQAAFTIKELRELTKLSSAKLYVNKEEIIRSMNPSSEVELKDNRPKKRQSELIQTLPSLEENENAVGSSSGLESPILKDNRLFLRFLLSPKRILADSIGGVEAIELEATDLIGPPFQQKAVPNGKTLTIPCQLVLVSVGYKSEPIPGLPFNYQLNTANNNAGRVIAASAATSSTSPTSSSSPSPLLTKQQQDTMTTTSSSSSSSSSIPSQDTTATVVPGLYVTGWLKRGPSGIIGTNITDAKETVGNILSDFTQGRLKDIDNDPMETADLKDIFHNAVSWKDVQRIEEEERHKGSLCIPPKEREKICSWEALLQIPHIAPSK